MSDIVVGDLCVVRHSSAVRDTVYGVVLEVDPANVYEGSSILLYCGIKDRSYWFRNRDLCRLPDEERECAPREA